MKTCSKCNKNEVLTKAPYCRPCCATYAREFRKRHPSYAGKGKVKAMPDKELSSVVTRCRSTAQQNNKRSGRPFTITSVELYLLFKKQEGLCAITKLPMSYDTGNIWKASIDRIDSNKGYVSDNVQWTCWAVNRAKGDLTNDDFIKLCRAVVERCNDYPEREYSQVAGSAQPQEIG